MRFHTRRACALLFIIAALSAEAQERIVIGGKAVAMVAGAVYLFPQAGARVLAVAGADQGLGSFLGAIDSGYSGKPSLDRNAGAEAYASLKPDAVIMKSSMRKTLGPALDALGIRQLYLDLETPDDYLKDIATLGSFFGARARAEEVASLYRARLSAVAASIRKGSAASGSGAAPSPRVLIVQASGASASAWEVPPSSWMQTIMAELSGGFPVWRGANPGSGWASINPEQIAAWNPDFIFVVNYRSDSSASARAMASDSRLASVKAVREGKVYGFPQDFYSWDQPDTRWILGLEWMAAKLNPEGFSGYSAENSAKEFFAVLYGMNAAAFDSVVAPRLGGDF